MNFKTLILSGINCRLFNVHKQYASKVLFLNFSLYERLILLLIPIVRLSTCRTGTIHVRFGLEQNFIRIGT
jgi:hypothetical protein